MILHIDMDAFYVSVEERDDPALKGKPVVVGGSPEGRGVVAAANYTARQYGIHSALPMVRAKRLCKHLVILNGRHQRYADVSREIRNIFYRYTPLVEPLSLDEAFLDVSASVQLFGAATDIGRRIKAEIKQELGLIASVGVASNKFVAKIASDIDKPDGFVVVEPGHEQAFLDPLPVSRLWGVGKVSNDKLNKLGIQTIAQIRSLPKDSLVNLFGKWGKRLWQLANAIDNREVVPDHQAKSISHEQTFADDIFDLGMLQSILMELTENLSRRLRRNSLAGRTIQLKLRFGDFHTISRAHTLLEPTHQTRELWAIAKALLVSNYQAHPYGLRLLGMGVSGLETESCKQGQLFDDSDATRQTELDVLSDSLHQRFGEVALCRAIDLRKRVTRGHK
ncbi:MAG: DNA polymerase IV [Acidiferrobacterales bacterium]